VNSPDDEQRINAIRMLSIDAVQKANSGHPGLPLGAAAMAYTLWSRHLRYNAADTHWANRDRFVLSAGHGSMLLYSLIYLTGMGLSLDDLKNFRQLGSKTPGHPELHVTPGVEVTTGPLGQGFANAVGLAIAEAHLGAVYNREQSIVDHHTYCIASDGDLMEGVASEAASLAGHLKLGKLIVLYDDNQVSLAASTDVTFTEDRIGRFAAYGWHTQQVDRDNGNDVAALDGALGAAKADPRPSFIAVRTTLGYGSPRANTFAAHGEPLGSANVKKTKEFFGWPLEPDFYVPDDVLAWWRDVGRKGAALEDEWKKTYAAWKTANPPLAAQFERTQSEAPPTKPNWPTFNKDNGAVATRESAGTVMNAIAADFPELVGGSADLDPSTKTYLKGCGDFQPGQYAGRNIHFGVREHAMGGVANGLVAHGGILPFTATFFNFLDYMKPSVRLAALNKSKVIFVFTHDSVFLGEDGPTHQPIEQLATLRATPNMTTIRPADALEALAAWKFAVAHDGPTALVLTRQKVPFLGERDVPLARGAYVLSGDDEPDMILIATGSEVSLAFDARVILQAQGIKTRVVSMPSMELFAAQNETYRDSILPPAVRARVSIEAGATFGWQRWVGEHGISIGLDHYGASAPAAAIANAFGFTPQDVAATASRLLASV
jgi:transketolase